VCYSVKYLKDKLHKYAKHHDIDDSQVPQLFDQHFVNGFSHPELPVIPDSDPKKIHLFDWGLIPFWVKDVATATKMSNQTLNARAETIFEKPSFRGPAMHKRCLILVDGFYEFYHVGKATVPYYLFRKDDKPMIMAGLWEKWELKTENIVRYSTTIVTTVANQTLTKIHNNPTALKRTGPRMPVILPDEIAGQWLEHDENKTIEKDRLNELMMPYPDDLISYYTVPHAMGKEGVGNSPKAWNKHDYDINGLP
jgi:putative SOS response-associated peptidase YedK